MNQFLLFIILAGVLLIYLIYAALRQRRKSTATPEAVETLHRMVNLPSLHFKHASALFDATDYQALTSDPRLTKTAGQYRENIRQLALEWLKALQKDIFLLWRFRRLLSAQGVFEGIRGEAVMVARAISLALLLTALRISVSLAGPFAFHAAALRVREAVHSFSLACAKPLGGLSAQQLSAMEQGWRRVEMHSTS